MTYRKPPLALSPAASPCRSRGSAASYGLSSRELAVPERPADLLADAEQAPASAPSAARELPQLLSVAEVGEMFGRAPRTVRSWIARGLIRRVKVGNAVFIPMPEIDVLLSSQD